MEIELLEDDIELVDDILQRITERQYAEYMYDELYSKYGQTQIDRVCRILINKGIIKDNGHIFIEATESTHFIVKKGGCRYLYHQQEGEKKIQRITDRRHFIICKGKET